MFSFVICIVFIVLRVIFASSLISRIFKNFVKLNRTRNVWFNGTLDLDLDLDLLDMELQQRIFMTARNSNHEFKSFVKTLIDIVRK